MQVNGAAYTSLVRPTMHPPVLCRKHHLERESPDTGSPFRPWKLILIVRHFKTCRRKTDIWTTLCKIQHGSVDMVTGLTITKTRLYKYIYRKFHLQKLKIF